jgi:hypothetical protein
VRSRVPGLRRISWVSVTVDRHDAVAEVHGIGHRLPRVVRVSLATASSLVADGTPVVVHRVRAA